MALPISYNLRNLRVRSLSSIMAVLGIAVIVFTFILVLALADGFRNALATTGSDRNAILLRSGSTAELNSGISKEDARLIASRAEAFTEASKDGKQLISPELLVIISHPKKDAPDSPTNLNVRGVSPVAAELRPNVKIAQGRWFEPGKSEVVVGEGVSRRLANCGLNETIRFAQRNWTVVGVFDSGGSSFDSEMWGDAEEMADAFNRDGFQSVTVRLKQVGDLDALTAELAKEQTLHLDVHREKQYYIDLAGPLRTFILVIGFVVCAIMSIGGIAGALNTMNSSVLTRIREIGTLRALGFSRLSILISFLLEVLLLSLFGALIGCVLSLFIDGIRGGTTNFASFSDISFAFDVQPSRHFVFAAIFAILMGGLGGLIPAVRGSFTKITTALRQI